MFASFFCLALCVKIKGMNNDKKTIILSGSLQAFFYEQLLAVNNKSLYPVPEPALFYSSSVLERSALSEDFFSINEGRIQHKVLGIELLKAGQYSSEKKKRVYKDIGDTALVMTGLFSKFINDKIVSLDYYYKLGRMAYQKLDRSYDGSSSQGEESFYKVMASFFKHVSHMITVVAEKGAVEQNAHYLLKTDSEIKKQILGVQEPNTDKAS